MSYEPYPGGGGYQPFPSGQAGGPPQRMEPPSSVLNAVKVMYGGAVASLINVVIALATIGSLRTTLQNRTNPALTTSQINTAVSITIGGVVVAGLIGIGLWVWMALKCKEGRNWARITGTVFFGIDTLGLLLSFAQPAEIASRILSIVIWLIGLAAVFLLWQRQSAEYFKSQSAPY
jgi:hypothetical protein